MLPEPAPSLRMRQVHLDFHTSPHVQGVGSAFDPKRFGETFARAHVNSVTVFARCHHGMAYYPSKVAPMHPNLEFDLLGAQIDALHAQGIRAPIYVTVVWDQHLGELHPEWLQRKPDGTTYGDMPERASWHWLSPGVQAYRDYLAAQTREILGRYGKAVDGFFFDILMTGPEGDCNPESVARRVARGLPDTVAGRKASDHENFRELMAELSGIIAEARPDSTIFYNSRFGLEFRDEAEYYTHVEIEALPTGGWGYGYFPLWVRYGRGFGLPVLGMTGRFHTHWGDFGAIKEPSALRFECGGILANGAACSIGDQLPPSGAPEPAVYDLIGEAYADVEAKEPWCVGARPVAEVALLVHSKSDPAQAGAAKMLLEEHVAFDVCDRRSDLSGYRVAVVPDGFPDDPELGERLRVFVESGGGLILGANAMPTSLGHLDAARSGAPAAIAPTYFRARGTLAEGLRDFDYVAYDPAFELEPLSDAEVLADRRDALFNREPHRFISHLHAPAQESVAGPAVVRRGSVVRFGQPLMALYQKVGTVAYRKLVRNVLRLLLPDPVLRTDAPSTAEVTVTRQDGRLIVHVCNYSPMRRGDHVEVWDEPTPLRNVAVWVRTDAPLRRAYLVPSLDSLVAEPVGSGLRVILPEVREHAMACLEF